MGGSDWTEPCAKASRKLEAKSRTLRIIHRLSVAVNGMVQGIGDVFIMPRELKERLKKSASLDSNGEERRPGIIYQSPNSCITV